MGFFDFLLEKANDKKATIFLALMHRVARSDGEVSDDEFTHIRNFTSSLNLTENQKIKLNKKLQNIPIEEAVQKSKKLSEEEKNELCDEMILVAKSDGLIDQSEIETITDLAIQMGINDISFFDKLRESLNDRLVDSNNLDIASINLDIATAKDRVESSIFGYSPNLFYNAEQLRVIKKFKDIEDSLESVITDDFYDQINSSNFDDSEIVLTHWLEDEDQQYAKLFMYEKITFFTLNKIFEFNMILGSSFDVLRTQEKSLNQVFIEGLKEILNPTINSSQERADKITISTYEEYLSFDMERFLRSHWKAFFGKPKIIENLKKMYDKHKHLKSREFLFTENRRRSSGQDYLCYEPDKTPKIYGSDTSEPNIIGEYSNVITTKNKVLEKIKSVINNPSYSYQE